MGAHESMAAVGRIEESDADDEEAVFQLDRDVPEPAPPAPSRRAIVFGIVLYGLCSSTLLVINKGAGHVMPDASFVLFVQFLASSYTVWTMHCCYPEMDIEMLKIDKVKRFSGVALIFYICLLSNTQALRFVNVETVIVVRCCSPIVVSIA